MARRRQWRDGSARGRPRRTPILRGLVHLANRGPWCMPLAAGVFVFVMFALVLPALIAFLLSVVEAGRIQPLLEAASGRPLRIAHGTALAALILGGAFSAWRFFTGRRVTASKGEQAAKLSRVASRLID